MQVSGEIVVGADSASFGNATAFIYLEDVGRADASANMLGRAKLTGLAHHEGAESRIPFAVSSIDAPDSRDIAIRVHISLDGDENVSARDLVSVSHNPAVADLPAEISVRTV